MKLIPAGYMRAFSLILIFLISTLAANAANIILKDTFNGKPEEELHGRGLEQSSEGSAEWISPKSGSASWSANGSIRQKGGDSLVFAPFQPEDGKIYSLKLKMRPDGPLNDGFFVLGFASNVVRDGSILREKSEAAVSPWLYVGNGWVINPKSRLSDQPSLGKVRVYRTFRGPGVKGGISPKETYGETIQAEILLNTQSNKWKVTWFMNGEEVRTFQYPGKIKINYVILGAMREVHGEIADFELAALN